MAILAFASQTNSFHSAALSSAPLVGAEINVAFLAALLM